MTTRDGRGRDPSVLPMTVYQRRYWARWAESPQSSAFNTPAGFEIRGELDPNALKRACDVITKTQEILHATFSADGTEQYFTDFSIDDVFVERTHAAGDDLETEVRKLFNRPFDLSSGPLLRIQLGTMHDHRHYLVISSHHVITDATWIPLLISTIGPAYDAFVTGSALPELRGPAYTACIAALNAAVTPERLSRGRAFWKEFLAGAPLTVNVPAMRSSGGNDLASASIFFELDAELTQAVTDFAAACDSTLFIVLSAMYAFLLARYANQDTVLVSYPINVRPSGFERVPGCFVNLALLKAEVGPTTSLATLVDELTRQRKEVRPHWLFPIRDLVCRGGEISADIEKTYFSVFFGETYLNSREFRLGDLAVRSVDVPWSDEFDRELRLLYDASDRRRIKLRMDYRTAHYDPQLILDFTEDFPRLLARAVMDDRALHQIADEGT